MTVFSLKNLTKVHHNRTVLDIEHLEIEKDRIYALLGPNGAGKTTLLHILGFLATPDSGSIYYRSRPVRFVESQLQALRRDVIMVDQFPILFSTTVQKNLEFGLKVRGISKKKRLYLIDEALDLVGMRGFLSARAHRLSGGETQRVALARALVLSPRVFLCDEPTSSVDVENQTIIANILRQINSSRKVTVVFTTHDRFQAAALAHRTLVLDLGRLVETAYENVFSALVECRQDGKNRCVVQPGVVLEMQSNGQTGPSGRTRIFIDPNRIRPAAVHQKQDPNNVLKGTVQQVSKENSKIRVVVDTGVSFTLLMPESTYRENRIIVGDTLDVLVPPDAIRAMGE
jgi:tungstate transport system ATP-binding protein